jgi:hypothetical protein
MAWLAVAFAFAFVCISTPDQGHCQRHKNRAAVRQALVRIGCVSPRVRRLAESRTAFLLGAHKANQVPARPRGGFYRRSCLAHRHATTWQIGQFASPYQELETRGHSLRIETALPPGSQETLPDQCASQRTSTSAAVDLTGADAQSFGLQTLTPAAAISIN